MDILINITGSAGSPASLYVFIISVHMDGSP